MIAKDFLRKDFVKMDSDANISEIVGKMFDELDAIPIYKEKEFLGIISINNIIERDYPAEAKAKNIVRKNLPSVDENTNITKLAKLFLENDVKALPIFSKDEVVGLVFETDLIKLSKNILSKKKLEIINVPEVIQKNENIGKARTIVKEKCISRLPVIDENGKLVGIIDSIDFLKTINPKEGMGRKDSAGDFTPEYKSPVTTIMNPSPLTLEKTNSFEKIINTMEKYKKSYVLITKEKEPIGIVTPKDILEVVASSEEKKGVYVQITGLEEVEDSFDKDRIDTQINEAVQKIGRIYEGVEYLFIHIKSHEKQGEQRLYSIRTRVSTPVGLYMSKSSDWNPIIAIDEALNRLVRQIKEDHERRINAKRPKSA